MPPNAERRSRVATSEAGDAPAQTSTPAAEKRGWQAQLELRFERRAEEGPRTVLAMRRHVGPLTVQRAFYPEADGTCHVYLLHPPGGVAGGDELTIDAEVTAGASVLLTTPAAGKLYRSAGATARVTQVLRVAADATLEWLPQENIVFDQAQAEVSTTIHLEDKARFAGWEILCFGRPASDAPFSDGYCGTRMEVNRAGHPLLLERGRYGGGAEILSAGWGLAGYPVCGTLVATAEPEAVTAAREAVTDWGEGRFGVTWLNGLLVARYLGRHSDAARKAFIQVWDVLRRAQGRPSALPRIWNT